MGRNLMAHWRSNIFVRIKRSALDPGGTLPNALQTGALLVRGSTLQGKFHIQVTASADPSGNSDALLYTMIPDIDQLDATLANQQAGWISIGFRGVSQWVGDQTTSVPNPSGRWINLSPYETDEFGMRRAYVQLNTTAAEDAWLMLWTPPSWPLRSNWLAAIQLISKSPARIAMALAPRTMRQAHYGWERIRKRL